MDQLDVTIGARTVHPMPDTRSANAHSNPEQTARPAPVQLTSKVDASVNRVSGHPSGGLVEARFVQREPRYFICYVSSHTGCNKGCRFCHLTQTAQTAMTDLTIDEIVDQAEGILKHYDTLIDAGGEPSKVVHFNFMARGEALANHHIIDAGDELVERLGLAAQARGLHSLVKVSTIWPKEMTGVAVADIFGRHQPDIYYSLYSTNPEFRRRWLPRAAPHTEALAALAAWQHDTRKIPVLHWAFIAGANDDPATIDGICAAVTDAGLRADINIVRYNPHSDRQGTEPSEKVIDAAVDALRVGLPGARVRVVPRVGVDVAASCGMFVGGRNAHIADPT